MWSKEAMIGAGVALAIVTVAGGARAQAVEALPPRFPVEIAGSAPGVSVHVTGAGVDLPCGEHCAAELPAGEYHVVATASDGRRSAKKVVIGAPSQITVSPHDQTARVTGMVLAPIGLASLVAGGVLFVYTYIAQVRRDGDCPPDELCLYAPGAAVGGLIATLGGLAVGGTGLYLWRQNAHAGVSIRSPGAPMDATGLRLRPTVGARGAGLALTAAF